MNSYTFPSYVENTYEVSQMDSAKLINAKRYVVDGKFTNDFEVMDEF
jgi:hypothetical protein